MRNKFFVILALALALCCSLDVVSDYKLWVNNTFEPVNQSLHVAVDAGLENILDANDNLELVIGLENDTFGLVNGYTEFYNETCSPVTDSYPWKVKGFISIALLLEVILVVMRWK